MKNADSQKEALSLLKTKGYTKKSSEDIANKFYLKKQIQKNSLNQIYFQSYLKILIKKNSSYQYWSIQRRTSKMTIKNLNI